VTLAVFPLTVDAATGAEITPDAALGNGTGTGGGSRAAGGPANAGMGPPVGVRRPLSKRDSSAYAA